MKTRYADVVPYVTKDGSIIRELMHPNGQTARHPERQVLRQSLAEAIVPSRSATLAHVHRETEELYHVTSGRGRMILGNESFEVGPGDTVLIPPGTVHCIENMGEQELRVLCCCSPAYSHEDTELCGQDESSIAADPKAVPL